MHPESSDTNVKRTLLDIEKNPTLYTGFTAQDPTVSSLPSVQTFRRGDPTNT